MASSFAGMCSQAFSGLYTDKEKIQTWKRIRKDEGYKRICLPSYIEQNHSNYMSVQMSVSLSKRRR